MKKSKIAAELAAIIFLLASGDAFANPTARACLRDINTHCRGVAGVGPLQNCVSAHFSRLSGACQALVVRARPAARACHADIDRFCGGRGPTRLAICVNSNNKRFGASCRAAFLASRLIFAESAGAGLYRAHSKSSNFSPCPSSRAPA